MKDNELGQGNMSRYFKYPELAPALLVLFKACPCLCWRCQWNLGMGERWCWGCWHSLIYVQTYVQSCACVTGLSLALHKTVGDNWMYPKPKWPFFFKLPHESMVWARETNKQQQQMLVSAAVFCSCLWKEEPSKMQSKCKCNALSLMLLKVCGIVFLKWCVFSLDHRYSFVSVVCRVFVLRVVVYLQRCVRCL